MILAAPLDLSAAVPQRDTAVQMGSNSQVQQQSFKKKKEKDIYIYQVATSNSTLVFTSCLYDRDSRAAEHTRSNSYFS